MQFYAVQYDGKNYVPSSFIGMIMHWFNEYATISHVVLISNSAKNTHLILLWKKTHNCSQNGEKNRWLNVNSCILKLIRCWRCLVWYLFTSFSLSSSLCPFRHNNQMLYAFHCVCMYNGKMIRFLRWLWCRKIDKYNSRWCQ